MLVKNCDEHLLNGGTFSKAISFLRKSTSAQNNNHQVNLREITHQIISHLPSLHEETEESNHINQRPKKTLFFHDMKWKSCPNLFNKDKKDKNNCTQSSLIDMFSCSLCPEFECCHLRVIDGHVQLMHMDVNGSLRICRAWKDLMKLSE